VVDARLLIEQHGALQIEPPQKACIGRHLRLQDHHRLLRGFLKRPVQAIQTPFTLLLLLCEKAAPTQKPCGQRAGAEKR